MPGRVSLEPPALGGHPWVCAPLRGRFAVIWDLAFPSVVFVLLLFVSS